MSQNVHYATDGVVQMR